MKRVRTRRHLSRFFLLFSSSRTLQTCHCLTLLFLGLASLSAVLSCDERTRPQSRDPNALPCHTEVRGYSRRDLDVLGVIPEWMQRASEASDMTGRSAEDMSDDDHSLGKSLGTERRRHESDDKALMTGQLYSNDDGVFINFTGDGEYSGTSAPTDLSGDSATKREVAEVIDQRSMKQNESSSNDRLGRLVGKARVSTPAVQDSSHQPEQRLMSELQFPDNRDNRDIPDDQANSTFSRGPGRGESDLLESHVLERNVLVEAYPTAVDYPNRPHYSRESSSVNPVTASAGDRRDRNEVGFTGGAERVSLNASNVFTETLINSTNKRAADYSARLSSRGNEPSIQASEQHIATTELTNYSHPGNSAENRSDDGKTVSSEATRQTHLDDRNIYSLDNRSSGTRSSKSTANYLSENDNFDAANESANLVNNPDVDTITINTRLDGLDSSTVTIEIDESSQFENRTEIDADYFGDFLDITGGIAADNATDCDDIESCRSEPDDDDMQIVRAKKFGAKKSNDDRRHESEERSAELSDISAIPGNDSDTNIDVDIEAPFTGFEGSQKFPVKVNHKMSTVPQVEKFDRRHFGPHKEDVLEETSTWYPSIAPPDLPKSPSRDVPLRHHKISDTSDDTVEIGKKDNSSEGTIEMDEKRNDTSDESLLPGVPSGRHSPSSSGGKSENEEKFATTPDTTNGGNENVTRGEDFEKMDIGVTVSSEKSIEKINITILGLFEMTHGTIPRPEGSSELQAAKLAVDRVNEFDTFRHFRLRLIYNDTKCDSGVAVDRFFHALYSTRKKHLMPFLLGTACSEVTETLAKIVPYWNVIQVSFGSTAPALSDSNEFPLFLRTVVPDSNHNPARIALIKHFGWDTVTAFSQTGDMYSLAVNDLVTELEQANITCSATITFAENDYKEKLRTLKDLDTRIIVGSFSPQLAQRVFCEAWKLGMHGGDYAWILPGDTIDVSGITGDWWRADGECSLSQLSQTLDGLIIVKSHATMMGDEISASGLTSAKFISELVNRGVTHSKYAAQTYDAVWAMALALDKTEILLNRRNESMAKYAHTNKDLTYLLLEQLKLLRFIGVSGPVSFDDADRVGITAFYQMHGHVIRRIAIYTPEDGKLIMNCPGCTATRWPGGQVPTARRVFRLRMVTVAPVAFLTITCIASVGVTLALAYLAFNFHFRKHKNIKLSSPRLNNIAAVGCCLVYGAVILFGLDDATLSDSDGYYPAVCTARVYLLSAGFSLAFGSMFTKTYRVHRIFTRSRSGVVKNKLLQDTQLISLICVLLLIDCLVVTLWVTLDPMQRHLRNLDLEINPHDRGVVYQPQVEVCRSQHTNRWLLALYVYKGLLLVVGVYMAWETRHVKIPALNDSQYIGMSVYLVVITSGIVVMFANLMPDRPTLAFVTITALILCSTTATLALLFLPQLANILAGERPDAVVQSFGLKIECNTRRFVTDDKRELQYRVEVQNRVYRREMAQLELELARLEKQLAQDPIEPSRASSSTSIPQRNPSIGGGLPLLLLSVLPPVIPRASWPSTDSSGMRRGTVAFSSQPDLEPDDPRQSLADLYKLHRRRETEDPNRLGVFQQLFSLFGSRPSSRKTSTASFTGVASALRVHMGYIAGLVPGTKAASTCQVDAQGTQPPHERCGSGPIISITSEEDRRLSLGLRRKESSEPRVNFSLPPRVSTSQSSSQEKIRGSPRFPHRIVLANSLSAIGQGTSISRPHRWHSMEEATKSKTTQMASRGSCSPNFDVWATRNEIPLSELANTAEGKKPPDSLPLTITVDSKTSPIDSRLGSDLRKLFKENDSQEQVSPAELYELKTTRSSSSSSSSLKVTGGLSDSAPLKNDSTAETRLDASSNFRQETKLRPSSPVIDTNNPREESNTDVDNHVDVTSVEKRPTTAV